MDRKNDDLDPDFIARSPTQVKQQVAISSEASVPLFYPPAIFNQQQIQQDLVALANTPTRFQQYVTRARTRYTRRNQIALLDEWIKLYTKGKELKQARYGIELADAEHIEKLADFKAKTAGHHRDQVLADVEAEEALNPKPPPKEPEPEPPELEPALEDQIESIEALLRANEQKRDLWRAVNREALPPDKQIDHNTKQIELDIEKRRLEKELDRLKKLVVQKKAGLSS